MSRQSAGSVFLAEPLRPAICGEDLSFFGTCSQSIESEADNSSLADLACKTGWISTFSAITEEDLEMDFLPRIDFKGGSTRTGSTADVLLSESSLQLDFLPRGTFKVGSKAMVAAATFKSESSFETDFLPREDLTGWPVIVFESFSSITIDLAFEYAAGG